MNSKPHAVLVPCPAQGHVTPFMQLAKLLHSRGFHITFVNTEFNHNRLIRTNGSESVNGPEDFQFETIPDGLPPSDRDATQAVPSLLFALRKHALAPFLELVERLNSSPDVPPVTCIIADGIMGLAIQAAEILGIPKVQFWTASACGLMGYLQFDELVKRGILPFKDETFMHDGTLDKPIDWIPGMPNVRFRDLPSFIRTTDLSEIIFDYMGSEAQSCLTSPSAIIINTFDAFEDAVLKVLNSQHPHIYTVGPLSGLIRGQAPESKSKSFKSNLWREDTRCLNWLDGQKPNSVIYVNYGSITTMSDQHLIEFAWGLANSKFSFIWVIRPDIAMGNPVILPKDFLEEVKERGFITSWCPQEQVLGHVSVGVFLTHCGWNSTLESLSNGIPIICWPFFAEQQTNCRYSCTDWEIGMEVDQDVKREEVEKIVKEMMEGEKGKKMRSRAQEWKRKAKESISVGGSSYNNFENFVKWLIFDESLVC